MPAARRGEQALGKLSNGGLSKDFAAAAPVLTHRNGSLTMNA
jgi:hypothetical protein